MMDKEKKTPWWIKQNKPNPLLTKVPWWIKQNKPNPALTANTGNTHSEETKLKISNSLKDSYSKGKVSMHGKHHSEQSKQKIRENGRDVSDYKNPTWAGNDVGYSALHSWVRRKLGEPIFCEECGVTDKNVNYEWSSISREYNRDLNDWRALCIPCHRKYDYKQKGGEIKSKQNQDTKLLLNLKRAREK